MFIVHGPAIAGMEPPIHNGFSSCLWLFPVPLKNNVGASQNLSLVVNFDLHSNRRRTGATQFSGLFFEIKVVPLRSASVHRQEG